MIVFRLPRFFRYDLPRENVAHMMNSSPTTYLLSPSRFAVIAFGVAAFAAICTILSALPRAGVVLLTDGFYPLILLVSCAGYGLLPARALLPTPHHSAPRAALALALGIGIVSILILLVGMAGWLSPVSAWLIVGGGAALGALAFGRHRQSDPPIAHTASNVPPASTRSGIPDILALSASLIGICALGISIGISVAGATLPPGMLWADEAGGYDALEYHLQAPREYFEAGRVHFLPHNVYASFPQVAEMQYLLLMHLCGGPMNAAIPAQLLHAFVGIAAILAIGAYVPNGLPRLTAIVAAGSIQWIAYLGCLAYVENFLLLFSVVAGGLLVDALRRGEIEFNAAIAAGLCAGFATGCKYTALAMVAAALAICLVFVAKQPIAARLKLAMAFTFSATAAFAPWMARNCAFTGNPFFPFLFDQLGGAAWSPGQNEQWKHGHQLSAADADLGRGRVALRELIGPANAPWLLFAHSRFGMMAIPLAIIGGILARKHRESWFLLAWCGLILFTWLALTHMPGRFVVILAAPLAWLAAIAVSIAPRARCLLVGFACLGAGIAAGRLTFDLNSHLLRFEKRTRISASIMPGQTTAFRDAHPLSALPADAYVWMIGDAAVFYVPRRCRYTVVFNRDPWLELCESTVPAKCLDALRQAGVTHLYVSWSEVRRLRMTYGFAESVTPGWVEQLAQAGLKRIDVQKSANGELISELFELPRN